MHTLLPKRRLGLSHIVAQTVACLRGGVETVGRGEVPGGALGLGGKTEPCSVVGRAAVGNRADQVVGGGEKDVGLNRVELHHGDLVLVEVEREHVALRGDVPELHRRICRGGGEDIAVFLIPAQAHDSLAMAAGLESALFVAGEAAKDTLWLDNVDYIRIPDFDFGTECSHSHITTTR